MRRKIAGLCMAVSAILAIAAQPPAQRETAAVRAVLTKQQEAWNRGDLDGFAQGYKNSPDILFIGRKVRRGYAQMLAGYRANYGTREKMGKLAFSDLEVQPLDERFVTATGRYTLNRSAGAGGNDSGSFLLVLEKTSAGWKIVRDDTRGDRPAPASATH